MDETISMVRRACLIIFIIVAISIFSGRSPDDMMASPLLTFATFFITAMGYILIGTHNDD